MHVCNLFIFIQVIQTQKQKSSENYSSFCLEEQLGDFCASLHVGMLKVAFFRKCDSFFKSPNLKKKIFQKTILSLKFKFPANNSKVLLAGNLNFKLRIAFWNIFFWRFGDLKKQIALSEKSHFYWKEFF